MSGVLSRGYLLSFVCAYLSSWCVETCMFRWLRRSGISELLTEKYEVAFNMANVAEETIRSPAFNVFALGFIMNGNISHAQALKDCVGECTCHPSWLLDLGLLIILFNIEASGWRDVKFAKVTSTEWAANTSAVVRSLLPSTAWKIRVKDTCFDVWLKSRNKI